MTSNDPVGTASRVLVVCGGHSAERDVSLQSGQAVLDALQEAGYQTGRWDPAERSMSTVNAADWDVVFPVLHGAGGEDGVLQTQMQDAGFLWIGCSADASALTFDKALTRERLLQHHLPVPPGRTITSEEAPLPESWPVVVKPARQGSSIGISVVSSPEEWQPAVQEAFSYGADVVVETFIEGREVSVPVIDEQIFPAVEICVSQGWYDYRNKYEVDTTEYRVSPEGLPSGLGPLAQQVCHACDASGILRVDFRLDRQGQPYVLEVNTLPGMTTHSLVPISAAAAGQTLAELCSRCVQRRLAASQQT